MTAVCPEGTNRTAASTIELARHGSAGTAAVMGYPPKSSRSSDRRRDSGAGSKPRSGRRYLPGRMGGYIRPMDGAPPARGFPPGHHSVPIRRLIPERPYEHVFICLPSGWGGCAPYPSPSPCSHRGNAWDAVINRLFNMISLRINLIEFSGSCINDERTTGMATTTFTTKSNTIQPLHFFIDPDRR
jgi:hypothetical protein